MIDIRVPQLSESITSGTVVNVNVKKGEHVTAGQTLIELETEKAVLEVPSPVEGVIEEIVAVKGAVVKVADLIFRVSAPVDSSPKPPVPEDVPVSVPKEEKGERVEAMSATRRTIAAHMARSWTEVPHVTHFSKADITQLENVRQQYKDNGQHVSLLPFLIRVVAAALVKFPRFNAVVNMSEGTITYKDERNIGVAIDTPHGLIVPVIRAADHKSIMEIAQELGALAARAKSRELTPDELRGGTFTITNLGSITGGSFTPIIKLPEVAILGVGRAVREPYYLDDKVFVPRLMLPLSFSYDHRANDGADAARFIEYITTALSAPDKENVE
jgi:pyruvate dehydrogenase E2 component (dihydrolipoamide acetyltransferase)